ncbi:MAG: hypothetical protein KDD04_01675, partial [Sinomicrobium sp.]|nr:hypothetical protein [Sinomicrobium sp.]
NVRSGAAEEENREGEGGGIVHAVIELGVTEDQVKDAQKALQGIAPEGVIRGPVIYKEGTIALISSFVKADGELSKQVLGIGKAPMLDGQRAAVSIQLTKQGAKILWESFKTPTPDMSISFEMTLSGYREPKRAIIEADFDQIYEHKSFQVGVAATVLAAEIKTAFDDMVKSGAIKVTQIGSDQNLEKIMETAYNKILDMMFQPSGGTGTPSLGSLAGLTGSGSQPSVLDRATTMLNTARTDARTENTRIRRENQAEMDRVAAERRRQDSVAGRDTTNRRPDTRYATRTPTSDPTPGRTSGTPDPSTNPNLQQEQTVPSFAIALSYEMKRVRQRGKFRIDLNKYTTDNITLRFDKNFGNIKCEQCFRQVNLDDALFKQRELVAFVDGANATDFGSYINFVTLTMKKKHQSGAVTNDEVRIDRNNFNKEGNNFKLLYGWKGDDDRTKWLDYEYKAKWSFFGGHTVETEWAKNDAGAIALAPPLLRKTITIEADPDVVAESNIRAIDVKFFYKIGNEEQVKSTTLKKDELSKTVDIILPKNVNEFEYEVNWTLRGNKRMSSGKQKTNSSVLFVDELPEQG